MKREEEKYRKKIILSMRERSERKKLCVTHSQDFLSILEKKMAISGEKMIIYLIFNMIIIIYIT